MGNSEVGHLNLGAGRVVKQDLVRINDAIKDGSFFKNPAFVDACRRVTGDRRHAAPRRPDRRGRRARDRHAPVRAARPRRARAACRASRSTRCSTAATRCRAPGSATCEELMSAREGPRDDRAASAAATTAWIATSAGSAPRSGTTARCAASGPSATDPLAGRCATPTSATRPTSSSCRRRSSTRDGEPVAPMRDGDAVICFNYRSDRMRQIVRALTDAGLRRLRRDATGPTCRVATMTLYDQTFDRAGRVPAAVDGAHRRRGGVGARA